VIVHRRLWTVGAVAAALSLVGCAMPDQISQIQKDLYDVQQDLREVRRGQDEAQARLAKLESRLDADGEGISRKEFADLKLGLEDTTRQIAVLSEQVQDSNRRLDRMASDVSETRDLVRRSSNRPIDEAGALAAGAAAGAATDAADVTPDTAFRSVGEDVVPDAEALYNAAYADFSKGNYDLAIGGFEEYAERFSSTPMADNALYWIGECHYSQGDFTAAIEALDRMLERYPDSDRAAAADLKKGMAYLENNAVAEAIVQLQYVVERYPSTDESRVAREKLVSLGAPVR
jgi:tol-pal system protein YbgF